MSSPADDVATRSVRLSADERREQILLAAIAVFGAKGYVGTTTDEVARAASVSQPYVVRLFGTKERLFLEVLDSALTQLMDAFRGILEAPAAGLEDVHARGVAMGQAYLGLLRVRGLHQLLSHAFLLGGHPVIGPRAREGFSRVWAFLRHEAGFSVDEAREFLASGMLINTMIGMRLIDEYGQDSGLTELFDECFPLSVDMVLDAAPRADDPW